MNNAKYTKRGRLADVIRLISVLSLGNSTFRTNDDLVSAIRGKPTSADDWLKIASEHPEFFRPDEKGNYIASLLRSFLPKKEDEKIDTLKPLSIEETQKMIDVAISLHDKEIARSQRCMNKILLIITAFTLLLNIYSSFFKK